jgi:drug/metabolite transporter (DMT)-like permease
MSIATSLPVGVRATPSERVGQRSLPLLIIALGGSLTGFSGILMRISETGPLATGGWRLGIAALTFLPFAFLANGKALNPRGSAMLMLAGVFFAFDIAFYHLSLRLTSVAHSTLIVNLAPVVALGAGVMFFAERLTVAKIAGTVVALSGAVLMTSMRAHTSGTLTGNALATGSMFAYALYLIVVKHARHKHNTLAIMVWSSATAAACLFFGAAVAGERLIPITANGWAIVVAMGLVTHVLGQGLIAFGMREAPVGLASILLLTQPLVAAIVAWPMFGEALGPWEIVGAGFVLLGLGLASRTN